MALFGFLFDCLCDEHGIQWAPIFFFFPTMRDANYADRHPCIGVWRHRREKELDRCKTPSNSSAGKTRTPSRQHRIHWKTVCKQLISPFLDNLGSGKEEFSERIACLRYVFLKVEKHFGPCPKDIEKSGGGEEPLQGFATVERQGHGVSWRENVVELSCLCFCFTLPLPLFEEDR